MKSKYFVIYFSSVLLTFTCANCLLGQSEEKTIDFESGSWIMEDPDARVMTYMAQKSLYLNTGLAYLKDIAFENGVIEVDIACHGNRGFAGFVFRFQSADNYELLYIRPHKSGLPDALQYMPVFNGQGSWQLYSNKGFTAPADIPHNRWIHLKIVVSGTRANVYLNNAAEPSLVIGDLKHGTSKGSIGLWARNGVANFANFRFSPELPPMQNIIAESSERAPGIIRLWSLSETFDAKMVPQDRLPAARKLNSMHLLNVESESTGLVNISRFRRKVNPPLRNILATPKDVVFAKAIIHSERAQVKKLSFGYSDDVSIFLNGQIFFTGKSAFRSRGPTFLGIVGGDNDAVYLNLKKGKNELVLAVTEIFGGWGFICKLEDMAGITLK